MRPSVFVPMSLVAMTLAGCGGASSNLDLGDGTTSLCGLNCTTEDITPETDDRGNPTSNTGNNTSLTTTTGDETIVLKKSVIANFSDSDPALSKLTRTSSSAIYELDPGTSDQSSWPKAKKMDLYLSQGNKLGASYKEYRVLTRSDTGVALDEELQVWKWKNSYGVQYRHIKSAGAADHQAWSFGGTRTAANKVPTSGSATYTGKFGATAKTWNWDDTPITGQTIARNNIFRLNGSSSTNVNFGSGKVVSTLTPETWNAYQTLGGATGFKDVDVGQGSPNEFDFMDEKVVLTGKLTKGTGTRANSITGTSKLVAVGGTGGLGKPVTGSQTNLFRGALFGPNANEFTGIFNLEATYPQPVGGSIPINDDRRGFLNMSGVVNGSQ